MEDDFFLALKDIGEHFNFPKQAHNLHKQRDFLCLFKEGIFKTASYSPRMAHMT